MTDRIEELFQQVMNEICKDPLRRFAELVAADEREACAKVCDELDQVECATASRGAAAIRARGEK